MTFDYILRISPKCGIFPSKIADILKALIHTTEKYCKKSGIPHTLQFTNITILFSKTLWYDWLKTFVVWVYIQLIFKQVFLLTVFFCKCPIGNLCFSFLTMLFSYHFFSFKKDNYPFVKSYCFLISLAWFYHILNCRNFLSYADISITQPSLNGKGSTAESVVSLEKF